VERSGDRSTTEFSQALFIAGDNSRDGIEPPSIWLGAANDPAFVGLATFERHVRAPRSWVAL